MLITKYSMDNKIIEKVDSIILNYGKEKKMLIPILQQIQNEFNYLPQKALDYVSENTDIKLSDIYGVSTFYSQFKHKKAGRHLIKVCEGTACHVKGAQQVNKAYKRSLGIEDGKDTDSDNMFTVDKVSCLGCCTIAPVVQIDNITYGHVEIEQVEETIEDFKLAKDSKSDNKSLDKIDIKQSQGEIRIGLGSCCIASGSADIKAELETTLKSNKIIAVVKQVGCVGVCNQVPLMEILKPNEQTYFYVNIKEGEVKNIIQRHFVSNNIVNRVKNTFYNFFERITTNSIPEKTIRYPKNKRDTPVSKFLEYQVNIATEHRGVLKPYDLDEYMKLGGFVALKKCLEQMKPIDLVEIIKQSGLRGRGGAGFPTGLKWEMVHNMETSEKYVICNGDEGDPGAFMDRMLLESYPFRVIEGLIIAAYAVKSSKAILYIRAEYPLAVERIKEAINICRNKGIIGYNIFNSKYSIDVKIFEGAGAFICGEETALITSIEGNRGIPKMRPPYPSEKGLWGKPTLINNTETFSMVPWIVKNGAEKFSEIGTVNSKGTKVFALAGKINRGGLIEVPMGISIRKIVYDIGGGIANGKRLKAVQIGGPSGGCIPTTLIDTPIDYESLTEVGAMMGSGGLVVLDETDCMVDIAHYFLSFTQDESCGKCTFCRVGTTRMLEILAKVKSGKAKIKDIDTLEKLAISTKNNSLCGLGKSAPNPVLSTLKYFKDEYLAHINGKCLTGKCLDLIMYSITDDCIGCTICAQKCPTDAIPHKPYEVHAIDNEKCIACDICKQVCPVDAVKIIEKKGSSSLLTLLTPK